MQAANQIGRLPAVFILVLSVGLVNHVLILPIILRVAGRDSWISPLLACVLGVLWICLPVYGTMKRLREPFWSAAERTLGKAGSWALKLPVLVVLLATAFNSLIDTISWSKSTYLPATPNFMFAICLLGVSLYAVSKGLRTIAFASCVLLPFVVLFGDFVMGANMPHKDYQFLKPFLVQGFTPVWHGALLAGCSLVEIYILVLYQHHIRQKFALWQLLLLMVALVLLTMGPLLGAITQFGPTEAAKMRYPAFSQWRLVQIGKYIEHLDFFAVYQWLSGSLIRIAISLYLVQELLGIRRPKAKAAYGWLLFAALTPLAQLVTDHMIPYRELMVYYFPASGLLLLLVSLGSWLVAALARSSRSKPAGGSKGGQT
ncbi:endospore germination permease [Paenibacillus sp. FSL W8-1187]|uniref:Spore germination protein XB n=1 Tax=Paenibacillus pasadenensis TaxID=217090 RepID=A0A2N5N4S4_9BACL|nr:MULTISPECIES: endospore germination permease [Paenibacillus]PLT45289.1 Spore germination protein XB [Paenibacillus pasadenensis]QGG55691.1 GerAB/ArcD/ProY family transporter [Paenibacillus sp. B01]